jgi:hypothetical protein
MNINRVLVQYCQPSRMPVFVTVVSSKNSAVLNVVVGGGVVILLVVSGVFISVIVVGVVAVLSVIFTVFVVVLVAVAVVLFMVVNIVAIVTELVSNSGEGVVTIAASLNNVREIVSLFTSDSIIADADRIVDFVTLKDPSAALSPPHLLSNATVGRNS